MSGNKKLIPRAAFTDPEWHTKELDTVLGARFFAGSDFDFSGKRYQSFSLGRHAVTCRGDGEKVHAVSNVCLHRCCLIDPPGSGERDFRCGYHGWRYGADGQLLHVPMAELSTVANTRLTQYPVASSHGFHFVGVNGNRPETGEVDELVARLGWVLSEPFNVDTLEHACNWKLLVENVIEAYHVSFVHTGTFVPAGVRSKAYDELGGGDYTLWECTRPGMGAVEKVITKLPGAALQYLHGFVFPNLFLATTNNLVGYIGQVLPLAVDKSILRWQLFELPAMQRLPSAVREQIRADAVDMNRRILLEDKVILEDCQRGMAAAGEESYQLLPVESQINRFHAMWHACMGD